MTRNRWIALVVLVVIGVGLLVAVVAIPWGDTETPDCACERTAFSVE